MHVLHPHGSHSAVSQSSPLTQLTYLLVQHRLPFQQQCGLGLETTELQSISRAHLSHPPRLQPPPGALGSLLQVSSLENTGGIHGVLGQ